MKTFMRRGIRLSVMSLGFVGLFIASNAVPGGATPSVGLTSDVLGRGTNASHGSLPLRQGSDIVVLRNTLAHGGSSGWHSHPGGAIVVVQQGEITIHASVRKGEDEDGPRCVVTPYQAAQAFVERPGEVVIGVNTASSGETIIVATFPSVPVGGLSRTDQPNPGTCPGV